MLLLLAAAASAPDYARDEAWLCRPARNDVCAADLTTTIVTPDGTRRTEAVDPARPGNIDCFYVYPTVSLDPGGNSDSDPGVEERGMTLAHLAPFRSVCRPFAPVYRQITLTAVRAAMRGDATPPDRDLAYADVRAAWRDYLARDNKGRPFVLVGHSQGSMMLKRLVAEEIDGKPVQRRMLSAILPGVAVLVPTGKDLGGDFKAVPLCRADTQHGCVVTWAAYRDTAVLPEKTLFGVSATPGQEAGCTNPAKLAGGPAPLDAMLGFPFWRGGVAQYAMPKAGWTVPTQFAAMPGLLSGECVTRGRVRYLSVHVTPGAARDLADATLGAEAVGDTAWPDWGFHVIDMAIVQRDLLRLVRRQHAAWKAKRGAQ